MVGQFTQEVLFPDGRRRTFHGRFWIKGDRTRWDYSGEDGQTVITIGRDVYIYDPFAGQVQEGKLEFPVVYSSIFKNPRELAKFFNIKEEGLKLVLTPKREGQVKRVVVLLDGKLNVKGIKVVDAAGSTTSLSFSQIKYNQEVDPKIFSLKELERRR